MGIRGYSHDITMVQILELAKVLGALTNHSIRLGVQIFSLNRERKVSFNNFNIQNKLFIKNTVYFINILKHF